MKMRLHYLAPLALALLLYPATAEAYVGPGAGIAFLTTFGALFVAIVVGIASLLIYPFRLIYRFIRRKKPPKKADVERAVIIGLDGLDPELVHRYMQEGRLPNLTKLANIGTFQKLDTTCPAMSPVAWSSFATGVHPSKHGIYDFLTRDPKSYLPDLSSTHIGSPNRTLKLGSWQIPLGKPELRLLRKSTPFWKILSKYGVPCSILRVPITFPPDHFEGTMLSAMCVPDLMGSQGTFTHFTTQTKDEGPTGGQQVRVAVDNEKVKCALPGPENPLRSDGSTLEMHFDVKLNRAKRTAQLTAGKTSVELKLGEYTDWTEVVFPMGFGLKLRGICRFRLLEIDRGFRLYATPVNIDPMRPIMPISQPVIFSIFLANLIGRFSTLGLAEDTWALNEGVLDEDAFLEQAWANHEEREAMFFEMLSRTPKGVITCVFDGTDRIQHMFMRYVDKGHPADASNQPEKYEQVIPDTYAKMDAMVGKVLESVDPLDPNTLLMVISDHGFKTFRRGINLNSWLMREGYLVLKPGRTETGIWFEGVDWTKTRAFALGLSGIFLNLKGREANGFIEKGEPAMTLAEEIADKLTGIVDPKMGRVAVEDVYAAHEIYTGPYKDQAPDLIVGYSEGWRASWDCVQGIANDVIFDDNTKAWSGDHCIDPRLVPGVLIANRDLKKRRNLRASITDLAPTLLEMFGVPPPKHMDGVTLAS